METTIRTEPVGFTIKAMSSTLPFNEIWDPGVDPPIAKSNSAGTPSHATRIRSACLKSDVAFQENQTDDIRTSFP